MKLQFLIILLLLCIIKIHSQSIQGTVTGTDKLPIPYATIYIPELRIGSPSNADGKFNIKLPSGKYKVEFRALGFQTQNREVIIDNFPVILNIELKEQVYSIGDVIIKKGNEDPANAIMRKAITLAPYYLNQIKHYKSSVYIKGSLHMVKIPKILSKMAANNGFPVKTGDVFVDESVNEIEFNAPKLYKQRVVSSRSNFPGNDKPQPIEYIQASMYQPDFYGAISPFSPKAFSYYKFRYEGVSFENGLSILKIRVIPRNPGQQLFSGLLFLIDKTYNIHSLDFLIEVNYGSCQLKEQFVQIKDKSWLPATHSLHYKMKGFGAKAEVHYLASVKYSEVENNTAETVPLWLKNEYEKSDKAEIEKNNPVKLTKNQQKIEVLMKKENLSTYEMIKLAKLVKKENDIDSLQQKSLEVKSNTTFVVDSNANRKSPEYWNEIRPIPLLPVELRNVQKHDSLMELVKTDTVKRDSLQRVYKPPLITPTRIIFGHNWYDKYPNIYKYSGFIDPESFWFHPTNGLGYNISGSVLHRIDTTIWLNTNARLGYSFSRKQLYYDLGLGFLYAPYHRGEFMFSTNHWPTDYSGMLGINTSINSIACLFFKTNYSKLIDNKQFKIFNSYEIVNGLTLNTAIVLDRRSNLDNISNYSFFNKKKKDYSPNIPDNSNFKLITGEYKSLYFDGTLEYTPLNRYKIEHGRKQNWGSAYPTFAIQYKTGLKGLLNSDDNFSFLLLSLKQKLTWGRRSVFSYKLSSGKFLKAQDLHFSDFYHVSTFEAPVSLSNIDDGFALLPYYKASTNNAFVEAHLHYTSQYLMLKYLPLLNKTSWDESLYFSAITESPAFNFCEAGYGFGNIFLGSSATIFASFDKSGYTGWGFKFVIPVK